MAQYFVLYKPYGILSQFSDPEGLKTIGDFPPDVYPVGRLDKDSEGLLLVTDDKSLNHYLLNPQFEHNRSYLVQVEGIPTEKALNELEKGVKINLKGKIYQTKKATAFLEREIPPIPERNPPIRYRKNVPDSWLTIRLKEGKNRQVRKMTASVGFPTLRLIRWSIEDLNIEGYGVGEIRQLSQDEIYALLKINKKKLTPPETVAQKRSYKPFGNKNRR